MKLLILGGTRFLGTHLVTVARARGHEVTLFNRGNYSTEDLGAVEIIKGDRHTELDKLKGRRWDAVVDTSGHLPRAVRAAVEVLSDSVERYVFISSQNAYKDVSVPGINETYPLAALTNEQLDRANRRTASIWRWFMSNREIPTALTKVGVRKFAPYPNEKSGSLGLLE